MSKFGKAFQRDVLRLDLAVERHDLKQGNQPDEEGMVDGGVVNALAVKVTFFRRAGLLLRRADGVEVLAGLDAERQEEVRDLMAVLAADAFVVGLSYGREFGSGTHE